MSPLAPIIQVTGMLVAMAIDDERVREPAEVQQLVLLGGQIAGPKISLARTCRGWMRGLIASPFPYNVVSCSAHGREKSPATVWVDSSFRSWRLLHRRALGCSSPGGSRTRNDGFRNRGGQSLRRTLGRGYGPFPAC